MKNMLIIVLSLALIQCSTNDKVISNEDVKTAFKLLALIGHSNGGDMTVLFAHKYPELASKIISMDNRRMELPRTSTPKIFTLRPKDYPADENVLPTDEELRRYHITVQFTNVNHSNMDNDANKTERRYLNTKILEYLKK